MPAITTCPSCGQDIKLRGKLSMGQTVECPYCDAELEVAYLDPLELDWAIEYESWDDEDYE